MGSFNPISTAISAVPILGTARQAYNDYHDVTSEYDRAQKSFAQSETEIAQEKAAQLKEINLTAEKDGAARRNALKRAMAKQQAEFGGQGIDTSDGSGQAVLLGLFKESEDEKNYRNRLDTLRRSALEQEADNKRKRNLLALRNSYDDARDDLINL